MIGVVSKIANNENETHSRPLSVALHDTDSAGNRLSGSHKPFAGDNASADKPEQADPTDGKRKSVEVSPVKDENHDSNNNRNNKEVNNRRPSTLPVNREAQLPRKKIPYTIVARQGASVKSDPSKFGMGKSSGRGTTLSEGETVSVIGRMVFPDLDDIILLRIPDGWIQECLNPSLIRKDVTPIAVPKSDDKIIGLKLLNYNMAQPKPTGWFGGTDKLFRLVMRLELQYPRDHVIRITRDLSEVLVVRDAIMNTVLNKKLNFVVFPVGFSELEGQEEFVNDVQMLLSFMELLEEWLSHVLKKSEFHKVNEVIKFIEPTEEDIERMNVDLMATGGLGGAYTNELTWSNSNNYGNE